MTLSSSIHDLLPDPLHPGDLLPEIRSNSVESSQKTAVLVRLLFQFGLQP
jgi:hypothetical protein